MLTEQQNPNSTDIDSLATLEMLQVINAEDAKVALVVQNALPQIAAVIDAVTDRMKLGGRLIYVGAGTSGRLGVLDAAECMPTFNTPPGLVLGLIAGGAAALTRAVEGAEDLPELGRDDLMNIKLKPQDAVLGIAASGRTPYVLGAIQYANHIGALSAGISCNVPAPLLEAAQMAIGLPVGPEVITGSTRMKAGTAQKMVLNMLSTGVMVKLGKVYGNLMVDVQVKNAKLADRARRIITQIAGITTDEAGHLLQQTDNNIKAAVVMAIKEVTPEEARTLLDQAEGHLRDIIGD